MGRKWLNPFCIVNLNGQVALHDGSSSVAAAARRIIEFSLVSPFLAFRILDYLRGD